MRFTFLSSAALAILVAALAGGGRQAPPPHASGPTAPVVVELFTSEGCSSCPPADRVLAWLAASQPVAGARVIALGEHVDYWDRLGWRDPFSATLFSDRQRGYARDVFHTGNIYTPQLVVAGRYEVIGSDRDAVIGAIGRAAADAPARPLPIVLAGAAGSVTVTVPPAALDGRSDIVVAVTEDGLSSQVAGGENRGRRLAHARVTRALVRTAASRVAATGSGLAVRVALEPTWNRDNLTVVAFLQDPSSRAIVDASEAPVAATRTTAANDAPGN